jgi:hypothetical protein
LVGSHRGFGTRDPHEGEALVVRRPPMSCPACDHQNPTDSRSVSSAGPLWRVAVRSAAPCCPRASGSATSAERADSTESDAAAQAPAAYTPKHLAEKILQVDSAVMLRRLVGHVRPGGAMIFHEPDWDAARSFPPAPTYDRCRQWTAETFRLAGTPDTNMVARLHQAFVGAGLPALSMRMQTFVGGGAGCTDWLQAVVELVGSLLPAMEKMGVAMAVEVEVETLAERLRREGTVSGSVIVGRSEVGAWSRVPERGDGS